MSRQRSASTAAARWPRSHKESRNAARPNFGATRLVAFPRPGLTIPITIPPRVAPRNVLDLGTGIDNLFSRESYKVKLQIHGDESHQYRFALQFSFDVFWNPLPDAAILPG